MFSWLVRTIPLSPRPYHLPHILPPPPSPMQGVNSVYRDWKGPNIVWDAAHQLFKVIDFGYMQSLDPIDMESFSDAGTMGECNVLVFGCAGVPLMRGWTSHTAAGNGFHDGPVCMCQPHCHNTNRQNGHNVECLTPGFCPGRVWLSCKESSLPFYLPPDLEP
jgi:hypothetical protein